jgi:hypothetical protein
MGCKKEHVFEMGSSIWKTYVLFVPPCIKAQGIFSKTINQNQN